MWNAEIVGRDIQKLFERITTYTLPYPGESVSGGSVEQNMTLSGM